MGVKFNREGFVWMQPDGTLEQDSLVSAYSHKRVVPTGVLVAVPESPGLFYRITHGESTKLSKAEHKALQQKAQAWLAALAPVEAVEPETNDTASKTSSSKRGSSKKPTEPDADSPPVDAPPPEA